MVGIRITPLDIQQRQFARKKLGGLDETDVTEFLARVARDYEFVHSENRNSREQVQALRNQLKDYLEKEKTLAQTLLSLQKTSGELRANAEREAESVLKGAELDAERIVQEARNEVRQLNEEIRGLRKLKRKLKLDLKNVLDGYYDLLKDEGRQTLGSVTPEIAPIKIAYVPGCPVRLSATADGVLVPVKVIPRARTSGVDGVLDGALKLRLASPPVDGKANAECLALMAALFGLKKSQVELVRGQSSRQKTVLLRGLTLEAATTKLGTLT